MKAELPESLAHAVATRLDQAEKEGWAKRLWEGDASLDGKIDLGNDVSLFTDAGSE